MKKSTKVIILIAASAFIIGIVICGITLSSVNFDLNKLSTASGGEYIEKSLETDLQDSIRIETDTDGIIIEESADNNIHICYVNQNTNTYELLTEDGVIRLSNKRHSTNQKWYSIFTDFNFNAIARQIKISVPAKYNGAIDILVSTGDINIYSISASSLSVQNSTGHVALNNTNVLHSIDLATSTGDILMNSIASQSINAKTATGNIDGALAGKITDYTITSKTQTGNNNLPETQAGGKKQLAASCGTGNISISFTNEQ